MKKNILPLILILAILGLSDSLYLAKIHYANLVPPCVNHLFLIDCGQVLRSQYSTLSGIPLALIGVFHYGLLSFIILVAWLTKNKVLRYLIIILTLIGAVASLYFMYLQLIMIKSICLYCILSALISFTLFFFTQWYLKKERKKLVIVVFELKYRHLIKPFFFLFDPETIHNLITSLGERLSQLPLYKNITQYLLRYDSPVLKQTLVGIVFDRPTGLSAGFDYEAKLTQTLGSLGFGFTTVGTITNMAYEGNSQPMLGRLPKSRSLMVNKGFKNDGAKKVVEKLTPYFFDIPIGISIGRTNSRKLTTQKESVRDIVKAFMLFEKSIVKHSYYELNISCPNLFGDISFYPPKNLKELLNEIDKLHLKKPVFVKMPIEKSDEETTDMLEIIIRYNFIDGVIFGNLQKDRNDPAFDRKEVKLFSVGNFSGKPTEKRSNELIKLAYRRYGKKLVIIGCGGIFNTEDAYMKIKLGASLVQLITGMIYQGPQLVAQINLELIDLLKKDGFNNISEAVGIEV